MMSDFEDLFKTSEPSPEQQRLEARATFKAFADTIGVDTIDDIIKSARNNQEKGLEGITIPADDGSFWIAVDTEVSFRIEEFGPFVIPMDTALAAIAELRAEQQPPQPS